jgi:hypothetical protein
VRAQEKVRGGWRSGFNRVHAAVAASQATSIAAASLVLLLLWSTRKVCAHKATLLAHCHEQVECAELLLLP